MNYKVTAYVHDYVGYDHNAGAETTLHDLLRAMVVDGWEVEVILSRENVMVPGPYEVDGVSVIPFSDKRQVIKAANGTNLFVTHLENSERVSVVGRKYRVPVVQVVHNQMDVTKQYVAQGSDLTVFNTEWVYEDFLRTPGIASQITSKLVSVVHPRVDVGRYVPGPQRGPERATEAYTTLVNLWDGSGRGKDGKGAHTFYEMARRFPDKKFLGVIGGYGEQRIESHPNVTILPHTTDMVSDVYHRTRVLLMPSRYESFGRVAIEGAACGVPTIASPTPGLTEALGHFGLYASPDDYDEWQARIEYLDRQDAYEANRELALQRAQYWHEKQEAELTDFLGKARSLAYTGRMLRGF